LPAIDVREASVRIDADKLEIVLDGDLVTTLASFFEGVFSSFVTRELENRLSEQIRTTLPNYVNDLV
jgi:hypothetical protein